MYNIVSKEMDPLSIALPQLRVVACSKVKTLQRLNIFGPRKVSD